MGHCDSCHNEYDQTFDVIYHGDEYTFDCFECAIHLLAPICSHCGCRIIGHGVESDGVFFCCIHCAQSMEHTATMLEAHDRVT